LKEAGLDILKFIKKSSKAFKILYFAKLFGTISVTLYTKSSSILNTNTKTVTQIIPKSPPSKQRNILFSCASNVAFVFVRKIKITKSDYSS
jgi:hypothetical protein